MSDSLRHPEPPVYLTSLDLKNVRCFGEAQTFSLTDGNGNPVRWNIVLGDNGVGKTTLLQCLAWMRPVPSGDPTTPFEPALNDEENEALNSLIRVGDDVSVDLGAEFIVGADLDSDASGPHAHRVGTRFRMRGLDGRLRYSNPGFNITSGVPEPPEDQPIFGYGAARRPGRLKADRGELSDPVASLFKNETELYDVEDILMRLDHRAARNEGKDRLQKVKEVIAAVLPDVESADDIKILGPEVIGQREETSGVRFTTPYGSVPLSGLSLGYQTTLTWVLDLALRLYDRYPDDPDPLSAPGIVLIDNIDLLLHPRWQRHLMEDLSRCFKAIQFVATAHSPLIVQAAENANITVLRQCEGQVIIDKNPELVGNWRADQILASGLFDIPTRSPAIEKMRHERDELLDRIVRNDDEERRLNELENQLSKLPTAENSDDQEAMDVIRRAAEKLRNEAPDPR